MACVFVVIPDVSIQFSYCVKLNFFSAWLLLKTFSMTVGRCLSRIGIIRVTTRRSLSQKGYLSESIEVNVDLYRTVFLRKCAVPYFIKLVLLKKHGCFCFTHGIMCCASSTLSLFIFSVVEGHQNNRFIGKSISCQKLLSCAPLCKGVSNAYS